MQDILIQTDGDVTWLKQIDKDGKSSYSSIVVLKDNNPLATGAVAIYPSTANNILNIKIASQVNTK